MRFQANFRPNELHFEDVYFCTNIIIFRHLELQIALAIPDSNE